ncbi:unnamed protein product [Paramecium sonneborni]|uniref:J domain-containing protein n=1 Tax=Paramecium sonneborni TaxID=65129 RepID=A0A8S1R331_9CILI|nr:unnamed protein product [Paramecium sonneborni]
MSECKITPRQHGRSKTKLNDSLQVQFKKPGIPNERLVVNKLGLKFDPVCWKKTHEKGRIQYVCIEKDCQADRRLGCAHCIIDEHDEHVSNKITVEQYCEAFECNYKQYVFQVAKLEETYKKCKMIDIVEQIDRDFNTIFEILKHQLKIIRDKYVQEISTYAETSNVQFIQIYNDEKQILQKIKEYAHKNLYEMTPAEMDHSLLLIGTNHIENIINKLTNFQEQSAKISSTLKAQWKWVYEDLEEKLREVITQIEQQNFNFVSPTGKRTPIECLNILMQDQNKQDMIAQYTCTTNKSESLHASTFQRTNDSQQPLLKLQPTILFQNFQSQEKSLNKPDTSKYVDSISIENQKQIESPKNQNKSIRQIAGSSSKDIVSPLKKELCQQLTLTNQKSLKNLIQNNNPQLKDASNQIFNNQNLKSQTQARQISPNGMQYYYQSEGKKLEGKRGNQYSQSYSSLNQQSVENRLSGQKMQNYHFTCNYINMKCMHNDLIKANPIFACCNQAYPCYECHDSVSNHKAHITIPSQRYCSKCKEIFTVNLLSTIEVKCYKFTSFRNDPYLILGVKKDASIQQIKDAYIAMCKKYHPDLNNQSDAKERFAEIHQAYNQLKQRKFYEQVEEEFKQNYYSAQSEEECFRSIFGFYFHENPQEYYKPENAQKRADYQEMLRKYKQEKQSQSHTDGQVFSEIKINRKFNSDTIYRYGDHTFLKVLLMFTFVVSVTSAYIFFYKKQTTYAKNTITDSQIVRMKTLALIRQQKANDEKQLKL